MNVRGWLAQRHSILTEALLVLGLYGAYELARGLVAGNAAEAERHARELVALERSLHVFGEADVQHAAHALPGLIGVLGTAYLTLHLTVTVVVLVWLHQRRPAAFAFIRTTLLVASGLALIGFLLYPTAPPRLAGIGIADTVSNGDISLNHGLVSSVYNPYAAVPSMHIGYALVVGASLLRYGRAPLLRALGLLYAPAVLLVVVATGNHFFVDAAAGALVAGAGAAAAAALIRQPTPGRITALPARPEPIPAIDRRAA
jgi:PAP2 superfamily protein